MSSLPEVPPPVLNVIGLMSGTSVDSIDAACIQVAIDSKTCQLEQLKVLGTVSTDLAPELRADLLNVMGAPTVSLADICRLNVEVGQAFGNAANNLIFQLKAKNISVDLIASHGQTLYHVPPTAGQTGCTFQVGEPAWISALTGINVVADFRQADMALGGHGAPLVPFADKLLFQHLTIAKAAQNIGGIANLTAIPALEDRSNKMMAFDTGPGNMIIDAFCEACFNKPFDSHGEIAAQGQLYAPMLDAMLTHPYFNELPPKSTGRELFGKSYALQLLEQWQDYALAEDMITTATHFTAITIVNAYEQFVLPQIPVKEVVVGGGGVYNITLMQLLQERFSPLGITLKTHEDYGIHSKYKEAIAFALLGYAFTQNIPGNIPSCTGARYPAILGCLTPRSLQ